MKADPPLARVHIEHSVNGYGGTVTAPVTRAVLFFTPTRSRLPSAVGKRLAEMGGSERFNTLLLSLAGHRDGVSPT